MGGEKRRYFGTDGIRGRVGEPPVTADFMLKLGWAAGQVLAARKGRGTVLIGKDTRISGYMLESALEAGLSAAGVDIRLLGPMPTPAIAYLTRTLHAQAGIVISASHNPYHDNGIKFFSGDGTKLPDEMELAIEAGLERPMTTVASRELGKADRVEDAAGRYIEFCKSTIPYGTSFRDLEIVVDCAHGATYHVAPDVFEELGARVHRVGVEPNGLNINERCGATYPRALQHAVRERGADIGVAFDGDGDRVIMVDEQGEVVDGDELLFIIARAKRAQNELNGAVVGTVMSNFGLEEALGRHGIELKRAQVGDRYVLELMMAGGCTLGGETSGHIICLDRMCTGDGIVSALQVLSAARAAGEPLHELKRGMYKYPQSVVNVPMERRVDVMRLPRVQEAVRVVESELAHEGRVLLRLSGTEPLVRVMVEGRQRERVESLARQLAGAVEEALGSATG
ncbi:MAG: phosphoglucosamine mutase [Gammaproteobacteria bacterium]|nr:phosphoglucosamine mutase [Gammaproteobacteria bacterium]NIR82816.1 phosphoglucosamine mutase [Gammaproteobacteria bacterium]NIR89925.1 phosphoglucosamine mutase [Gammaproteobacteria bacterium]NIU03974.1 phosphoglucosamine mutase [Gammaproteobacteria bacterium]NIV51294.1 phosphoglucosamine mutase [Gammaproteobacteria bacterium]